MLFPPSTIALDAIPAPCGLQALAWALRGGFAPTEPIVVLHTHYCLVVPNETSTSACIRSKLFLQCKYRAVLKRMAESSVCVPPSSLGLLHV